MLNSARLLVLPLLVLPLFCFAQNSDSYAQSQPQPQPQIKVSGFYLGGAAGISSYHDGILVKDGDDYNGFTSDFKAEHSALKLYSGYQINRIVGVEASYTDYGDINNDSIDNGRLAPRSVSVAANLGYSFNSGWRPYGIVGLSWLDMRPSEQWFENDKIIAFHYGFGGEYQPKNWQGLTFRLAYEADFFASTIRDSYLNPDSESAYISNLGNFYIGASYKF